VKEAANQTAAATAAVATAVVNPLKLEVGILNLENEVTNA
jgi:hypothetical protein